MDKPSEVVSKGVNRSSLLARLAANILSDLSIDISMMERLISRYVQQKIRPQSTAQLTQIRSGIKKELFHETMSIKVFLKLLRILRGSKITFSVEIERDDGIVTKHSINILIDQNDDEIDE